ncbi:MAG: type II secretion system F family protein [Burkholderiales bacterium]
MNTALAFGLGGISVALCFYALWQMFSQVRQNDEATYRDDPPVLFKFFWVVMLAICGVSHRLLNPHRAQKLGARLLRAGVAYALTPEQFLAGQFVYAAIGAALFWFLGGSLELPTLACTLCGLAAGFFYPSLWLKEQTRQRQRKLLKALPFFLDVLTLGIEAGLNMSGAIQKAVEKMRPGPLTQEMKALMRDVRAGRSRLDALREMSARLNMPAITSLVNVMVQAELTGSSLGPVLRAQSDQRRTERFQRAEKIAMEAPVKMLVPLVMFIFPCTFMVIGFPIVVKFFVSGI